MFKKIIVRIFSALLLANNYGCIALLAGAAGGAGTAAWLSGKLSQEVNVPLEKALKASKSALKSLKLKLAKETITGELVQVMSNYSDGRTVWIDLRRVSDEASRIEVRVGAAGDKEAARKILERILRYL
jgi:hypothetical protein